MILGWDIGGANTKVVALEQDTAGVASYRATSVACDIRHDPSELRGVLRRMAAEFKGAVAHAVTMTAELSRAFRTKREGVTFVLDALAEALPGASVSVYTADGTFVTPDEAKADPLATAASNWMATASLLARTVPNGLLIDIGSTSTDIIPIIDGTVAARGRTDPARLGSGELVYTGATRTPAESVVRQVPLGNGMARVAAEGFAVTGDAYLWLGRLTTGDYTAATPDGRPAEREFAGERLARFVCADRDMLDDDALDGIAHAIAHAQLYTIVEAVAQVRAQRDPPLHLAVIAGLGDFIAAEAARLVGLQAVRLADRLGSEAAARAAPAAAVATLLGAVLWQSS